MGCLNLTTGRIIVLFSLQRSQLLVTQDDAFGLYLGLQGLETVSEVGQIIAQPNAAYTTARDKNTLFPQFVTGALLSVRREVDGMPADSRFRGLIYSILVVGPLPSRLVEQGLNTAFFNCCLVAVKGIAGQAHHLAGLGDVAEFLRQVQQAQLVFDDSFVTIKHEGYLSMVLIVSSHFHQNR